MKRLLIVFAFILVAFAGTLPAQVCDACAPLNIDPGGGGDGGGGGCLYCYTSSAPYGNCFSGASGLSYPQYSNCQGTRICWTDGSGAQYCEPTCTGSPCYWT